MTQPEPLTEQQLDEITARAAHLHEYATLTDVPLQADADQLTGEDVPVMRAEIDRLKCQRKFLLGQLARKDAASGAADAALAAFLGPEVPTEPETATEAPEGPPEASSPTIPPRRTLTPNEYDSAWHAIEGAAGEEGADPGTVLHAVLNRLGIEWQDAAQTPGSASRH